MTRLHVPMVLRWSDLDAYGHVNNAVLLRLLEEARIQVFWAREEDESAPPTAVIDAAPGAGTLTFIARQEVEYLAPIPYLQQPLDIQLWMGRMGGASLDVCYEVWSPSGVEPAVVYARATTTAVLVDAGTQRPRRIGDAERAAWEPYLEAPIEFRR